MTSLIDRLSGKPRAAEPPAWAAAAFGAALSPLVSAASGEPRVWSVADGASTAAVTEQFTVHAEAYHRRYAASDHFEALFRQALAAAGITVAPAPLILDLGSGSGVNSVIPCRRVFPDARIVATDLSAELLAMLAAHAAETAAEEDLVCVKMDAMSRATASGAFDLVTGASILHHLDSPPRGVNAAARALKPGGHAIFFEPFNGWATMWLAVDRILVEADLRRDPLAPEATAALARLAADVASRTSEAYGQGPPAGKDDKWLFSRTGVEAMARAAGFAEVRFVPHNDHATLYRDAAAVQLRLASGRDDLSLPDWALKILNRFDAAMTLNAKRELMLDGSIVLTKAA